MCVAGVLPAEGQAGQWAGEPHQLQPADGEAGAGVLPGLVLLSQAAERGRHGQARIAGHAGHPARKSLCDWTTGIFGHPTA